MNEECIIRKLIADGDGGGDDRRFFTLLPLLLKVAKDPENSQSVIPRIMKILDAAETALRKQVLISEMNEKQIEEYTLLTKQTGKLLSNDY
ncbi:unnamed protein product [Gongylonema pulchrum]|uniref:BESS domain-containing protein n=1 Tax=Gongylonema pulchrum TaxID=637853 RepID=A0A183DZB7_9BILA|nr:unnamed protein product [Gongylonema pulchrum]